MKHLFFVEISIDINLTERSSLIKNAQCGKVVETRVDKV